MNLSILAVASAAAVMSVVAVTNPPAAQSQSPGTQRLFQLRVTPEAGGNAGDPAVLGDIPLIGQLFAARADDDLASLPIRVKFDDTPLEQALAALTDAAAMPSIIRWDFLDNEGITRDRPVTLAVSKDLPFSTVVRLLNEAVGARAHAAIEYRVNDGILELAPRAYFDRRETELVSYDLSTILAKGVTTEAIVALVTSLAERDNWVDNGGDLATAHALADRLFISAPPRMHERVAWILRQLEQPSARSATGAPVEHAAAPSIIDQFGNPIAVWKPLPVRGKPLSTEDNAIFDLQGTVR